MSDFEDLFDRALAEEPVALSPAGAARREALRGTLERGVVRRRRGRAAVRWGVAAMLVAATLPTALRGPDWTPTPISPAPPAGRVAYADLEVVRDDPGVLARCAVDDTELLTTLAAADRPTGLIRVPGRVILTADVLDHPQE
jgi:hypothetical protein